MTRKKVKLAYILNDKARKACLKKRRAGLLKKVSELTVLCGVDAFCIIYSPEENNPMIFPLPPAINDLLARFQNLSDVERGMKSMNQEKYLMERVRKAEDLSKKEEKKKKDMDLSNYMHQLHFGRLMDEFTLDKLTSFGALVQEKLMEINRKIEYFQQVPPLSSLGPFLDNHDANATEIGFGVGDFTLGFANFGENFHGGLGPNHINSGDYGTGPQFHQLLPYHDVGDKVNERHR